MSEDNNYPISIATTTNKMSSNENSQRKITMQKISKAKKQAKCLSSKYFSNKNRENIKQD